MREVSFEESKEIMIKTLESIDKCCRENNIKYSVCWGTMIGAIRHHGFIPWDDDIDIMMPREDYNRFLNLYNDSEYGVYTPKVSKDHKNIITKVSGCSKMSRESGKNRPLFSARTALTDVNMRYSKSFQTR